MHILIRYTVLSAYLAVSNALLASIEDIKLFFSEDSCDIRIQSIDCVVRRSVDLALIDNLFT